MLSKSLKAIKYFYIRYERILSSFGLISGFVFDAVTLKRVDLFLENFWVIIHLLIAGVGIIAINYVEQRSLKKSSEDQVVKLNADVGSLHFWLVFIVQFAFGGLLSTFLVYYFRGATLATSWPFLLLLAFIFVANELFKKHYARLYFQISMLFISIFAFAIFGVPLLVHAIGSWVFIISGIVSLVILGMYLYILEYTTQEKFRNNRWVLTGTITGIYLVINILYFTHTIPPLPLSLKDAGVYHSIVKNLDGNYDVSYEPQGWFHFFQIYEPYNEVSGQPVYIFSSVFSPADFSLAIIHQWQYLDSTTNKWITESEVRLPISGGRDDGFRTYSEKTQVQPGKWRVNILTSSKEYLGRVKFEVMATSSEVGLAQDTL